MELTLEQQWSTATARESSGDLDGAYDSYKMIVEQAEAFVPAWLRLSALDQRQGRYRQALTHAVRAGLSATRVRAYPFLAQATYRLLQLGELELVLKVIRECDWSSDAIVRQSPVLSQHLWLCGAYDTALSFIAHASRRVAPSYLLSYSKANALRYSGQLEEATVAFEQALTLCPDYSPAHWSLAYHRPSVPRGARVDRIRGSITRVAYGSLQHVDLQFALFKELDDLGDTETAWAALELGARLKRGFVRYDSVTHLGRMRRIRDEPPSRWQASAADESDARVPIFIVGMPRTGTTLLERMLGNHSEVFAAGELNEFTGALSWELDRFDVRMDHCESCGASELEHYPNIGKRYLKRIGSRGVGKRFLIDKNPTNFAEAGRIAASIPSARVICLLKQPMDACFSNFKELFDGDAYPYSYDLNELADYHREFRKLVDHWQDVLGSRFLALSYEKLVTTPSETIGRVMEFCGLPHEARCLQVESNPSPVATASSSQVREPIHTGFVDAWKSYAPALECLRRRLGDV